MAVRAVCKGQSEERKVQRHRSGRREGSGTKFYWRRRGWRVVVDNNDAVQAWREGRKDGAYLCRRSAWVGLVGLLSGLSGALAERVCKGCTARDSHIRLALGLGEGRRLEEARRRPASMRATQISLGLWLSRMTSCCLGGAAEGRGAGNAELTPIVRRGHGRAGGWHGELELGGGECWRDADAH